MSHRSDYFGPGDLEEWRTRINDIADQLCVAVSGNFDFSVKAPVPDETLDKLAMLINFVIEAARRSLLEWRERNEKLSELDKMKSAFLANISHELRTPLTLLLGPLTSMLAGHYGAISPAMAETADRMLRNANRLNVLVNDLLDFSKLEARKMKVSWVPVDLGSFISILVSDLEPLARERGIRLHSSIQWEHGNSLLDSRMVEKVVLNLLSNALKFTPEGGDIFVKLAVVGERIRLEVRDTGPGISAENQTLIFQRFQQGDSASNRKFEGTGLGLALVQEFVEMMGGKVGLASAVGRGSCFWVELPLKPYTEQISDSEPAARPEKVRDKIILPVKVGKSLAAANANEFFEAIVLVVEDNADMRAFVAEQLGPRYRIFTAGNGVHALEILKASQPDLILSDVMMPEMDGIELLKIVKGSPQWQAIPVILLTARSGQESKINGLDQGADDYLSKPFDVLELRSRVKAALRMRKMAKELEEKNRSLEAAQRELAAKVEERTFELNVQTQRALAANRAKDQFLANMSHEMRTPLTAIKGFSDLLEDENLTSDERRSFKETVHRNVQHLVGLIDEILDLSKIEAGKLAVDRTTFSLPDLLGNIMTSMQPIASRKSLYLKLHSGKETPQLIISDPLRVRQILNNLIGNAIKFTEAGGVQIEVKATIQGQACELRIDIRDTGVGISETARTKLFQPFSQGDMSLTRKFGGTGLGLALSRKIAQAMGGDVWLAESEGKKGSTFSLRLGVELPISSAVQTRAQLKLSRRRDNRLSGFRILVAEDSADNQILIQYLLESSAATVDIASDGVEALEKVATNQYDIVLMDIQMPRMDGYEATRRLRQRGFTRPILALTAHAMSEELERIVEAGCNDRLVKPVNVDQLVSSILASASTYH